MTDRIGVNMTWAERQAAREREAAEKARLREAFKQAAAARTWTLADLNLLWRIRTGEDGKRLRVAKPDKRYNGGRWRVCEGTSQNTNMNWTGDTEQDAIDATAGWMLEGEYNSRVSALAEIARLRAQVLRLQSAEARFMAQTALWAELGMPVPQDPELTARAAHSPDLAPRG